MQKRTSRQFSPEDRHSFRALQHNGFTCEWARVRELLRGMLCQCCTGLSSTIPAECMYTHPRGRRFGLIYEHSNNNTYVVFIFFSGIPFLIFPQLVVC